MTVWCRITFHVKPQHCPESITDHLGTLKLSPSLSEEHRKISRSSQEQLLRYILCTIPLEEASSSLVLLWRAPLVMALQQGDQLWHSASFCRLLTAAPECCCRDNRAVVRHTRPSGLHKCKGLESSVKRAGMKRAWCAAVCGCTSHRSRSRQGRKREEQRKSNFASFF